MDELVQDYMNKKDVRTKEDAARLSMFDSDLHRRDILVFNKGTWEAFVLPTYVQQAFTEKKPLSYLMLDCDGFGMKNKLYGWDKVDDALENLIHVIKQNVRQHNLLPEHEPREKDLVTRMDKETVENLGRLGGDEFGVALYGAEPKDAYRVAERLRLAVENSPCQTKDDTIIPMTVTIGVSSLEPWMDANDLRRMAICALKDVKSTKTRNTTVIYHNGRVLKDISQLTRAGTDYSLPFSSSERVA